MLDAVRLLRLHLQNALNGLFRRAAESRHVGPSREGDHVLILEIHQYDLKLLGRCIRA